MSKIRDAILQQMLISGLTIYQVAKLVADKVPQRTVYAFLTGEKDTGTETAAIIMEALGLTVVGVSKRRKRMEARQLRQATWSIRKIISSEQLTDDLTQVLGNAQAQARRWNHGYVGTEHYLLALMQDTETTGAKLAGSYGVDFAGVEEELGKMIEMGSKPVSKRTLVVTPRAKDAIRFAVEESHQMNMDRVGTGHLLLGLMTGDSLSAQVLSSRGITLEDVRTRISEGL